MLKMFLRKRRPGVNRRFKTGEGRGVLEDDEQVLLELLGKAGLGQHLVDAGHGEHAEADADVVVQRRKVEERGQELLVEVRGERNPAEELQRQSSTRLDHGRH
jgi:hypothetical protein